MCNEVGHQFAVRFCVNTKSSSSRFYRTFKHHCRAIIQRMRERSWWLNHLKTIALKRKRTEEKRVLRQRVNRRAHIVYETRQCQLHRATAPSNRFFGLEYRD